MVGEDVNKLLRIISKFYVLSVDIVISAMFFRVDESDHYLERFRFVLTTIAAMILMISSASFKSGLKRAFSKSSVAISSLNQYRVSLASFNCLARVRLTPGFSSKTLQRLTTSTVKSNVLSVRGNALNYGFYSQ